MPCYDVHLYREMRLLFEGIEVDCHEEAAAIADRRSREDADFIDDCHSDDFAALVDFAGDESYEQSRFIAFEAERLRRAAPKLLEAVQDCIRQIHMLLPPHRQSDSTLDNLPAVLKARAAIAAATAADDGKALHL